MAIVIGPGPTSAALTYVGYDPKHGRCSGDIAVPCSTEGEDPKCRICTKYYISLKHFLFQLAFINALYVFVYFVPL